MSKPLDYENLNENVKKCQYAVRGELYLRASELQKEGKKIIFTNVGNPHALGQKPLTFPRQVIALCQAPFLLDDPNVGLIFPADAIARAKQFLAMTSGGLGAYSDSRGIPGVRKEVAEFIERRDGYPSDPELIFLTDGASKGVMQILNSVIRGPSDGILVPVPQYPLYSASIQLLGGSLVPYFLEETANWGLDINDLRQSVAQARFKGITVRAMVIINPGNPTGQCLSVANLKQIIQFCHQENLVLLGDEVYQQNIYQDERPFISARKVLLDMGPPISKELQLVSFHTVSKGYWGECGQRGGYFEMTNIPPKAVEEIYKVASISLSPNVPGQIFMGLMVNPPKPGDISYDQYVRESKGILESLRRRAHMMTDGFNSCRNVVCAMYSFPQIRLPPRAIEAANKLGKAPDVLYCLRLLEATGISTVPGSGFGQKEGFLGLQKCYGSSNNAQLLEKSDMHPSKFLKSPSNIDIELDYHGDEDATDPGEKIVNPPWYVVGRVFTDKFINPKSLSDAMGKAWRLGEGMANSRQVELTLLDIWIQVYDLIGLLRSKRVLRYIGNTIDKFCRKLNHHLEIDKVQFFYGPELRVERRQTSMDGMRWIRSESRLGGGAWHNKGKKDYQPDFLDELGISIIRYASVKFRFENSWLRETNFKEAVEEDNTMISFEVMLYPKRKTQGKVGYATLKMDMSKAYDRVEWGFPQAMMVKMGFCMEWVNKVMNMVTTVTYQFIHGGKSFGNISPRRGLRQGWNSLTTPEALVSLAGVDMVLRNHLGQFIAGKTMFLGRVVALYWPRS
ncbi:putative alanine aminotransferase, mitochondrial [Capsicum annuum]|nr:putative alanine aminotransferase, mitochondrial [Capsicum annuum]